MHRLILASVMIIMFIPSVVTAQGITSPVLTAPTNGQVLHGQVSVTGTTDIPNFASAELDFAYASDSTGTWFLIQTFSQPIADSVITTWDTTSVTDGDYILRLRVTLQDGSFQDATVNVKVQNETALSTATSTMTPTAANTSVVAPEPSTTIVVIASSTSPPVFSTPTSLPPNPAEVQTNQIYAGVERGALVIIALFVFFGILIRLRRS
jgi:hypothetical protein